MLPLSPAVSPHSVELGMAIATALLFFFLLLLSLMPKDSLKSLGGRGRHRWHRAVALAVRVVVVLMVLMN